MKPIFLPSLMAAFVLAGAAQAEARSGLPAFELLDSNNTGEVTPEDFAALLRAPQDRIVARLMEQANDDGLLDEAALRAGLDAMWPQGRSEMRADRAGRLFARIDSNGDGVIDAEEYDAFTARMQDRAAHRGQWRGRQ